MRVVVARHALDAGTVGIHFVTKLIFGNTSAVRTENKVRIAFEALALFGNEAVGEFATVVQESISCCAVLAASNEVI